MPKRKISLLTLSVVLVAECIWLQQYLAARVEDIEIVGGALLLGGTLALGTGPWVLYQLRGTARLVFGLGIGLLSFFFLFFAYIFLVRW